MKKIRLYGELAKKFGREFRLDVRTPAEAVRALCVQLKGFRQHLERHSEPGYVVKVGREYRDADDLTAPSGQAEVIRIAPVIAGANAVVRTIIGIGLIAASFFIDPTGTTGPMIANAMFSTGVAMTIGGIAEMLAPSPPKLEPKTAPEATPSYMFDGPVNVSGSGYAVPVGYGRLLIGSLVVSAELYSVEEAI